MSDGLKRQRKGEEPKAGCATRPGLSPPAFGKVLAGGSPERAPCDWLLPDLLQKPSPYAAKSVSVWQSAPAVEFTFVKDASFVSMSGKFQRLPNCHLQGPE